MLFFWSSPVLADGKLSAAVFNLEGDTSPEMLETCTSVLRNEAQQHEGYKVVNKIALNLSDSLVLLGCSKPTSACLSKVSTQLNAEVLLFGRLKKEPSGQLRLTVEFFDQRKGRVTNRLVRMLSSQGDLVVNFRKEIENFFKALDGDASGASLQVTSNVRGATIKIDGQPAGATPYLNNKLKPGRYQVEVSLAGYETWRAEVKVSEGAELKLWAPLKQVQGENKAGLGDPVKKDGGGKTIVGNPDGPRGLDPGLGEQRTPSDQTGAPNWPAWGMVGLGGLAMGGSLFAAIQMQSTERELTEKFENGTLTPRERDDLIESGTTYETTHRVLLGIGGALVIAGGSWLLIDLLSSDDEESAALQLGVHPRGVNARLTW